MYTKNSQTAVIGTLVGSTDLAEIYVLGGDIYLARGHLAPNADFMNYAWQVSFLFKTKSLEEFFISRMLLSPS